MHFCERPAAIIQMRMAETRSFLWAQTQWAMNSEKLGLISWIWWSLWSWSEGNMAIITGFCDCCTWLCAGRGLCTGCSVADWWIGGEADRQWRSLHAPVRTHNPGLDIAITHTQLTCTYSWGIPAGRWRIRLMFPASHTPHTEKHEHNQLSPFFSSSLHHSHFYSFLS